MYTPKFALGLTALAITVLLATLTGLVLLISTSLGERSLSPRPARGQTTSGPVPAPADALQFGEVRRHVEPGHYSFVPPRGWLPRVLPGLKFKAFVDSTNTLNPPSLNIVDEEYTGSPDEYATANLVTLPEMVNNFRLLNRSPWATHSGLNGIRLDYTCELVHGRPRRNVAFLLPGDDGVYFVLTCSSSPDQWDDRASLYEATARSFRESRKIPPGKSPRKGIIRVVGSGR